MARFAWAIFLTAIVVIALAKLLEMPQSSATETWSVFGVYAVVAFILSAVFRSVFARVAILLGLGVVVFGSEIVALIIPRRREFLDFNSLRFLAGCFGIVTGSAWARCAIYVMARRKT